MAFRMSSGGLDSSSSDADGVTLAPPAVRILFISVDLIYILGFFFFSLLNSIDLLFVLMHCELML